MNEGGSEDQASLSRKSLRGGLRGAPSLRTLENMLRKSPDAGISPCGPLSS
jgi:hypothetical protein